MIENTVLKKSALDPVCGTCFTSRRTTAVVEMRGTNDVSGSLFSYVDLEDRIPTRHPLRMIRQVVNEAP